jgi:hypothetical protein
VAKTVSICNAALAADGDPHAKVTAVGGRLIIQSASRPFHAYAAQIVTGLSGVETTVVERIESTSTALPGLGGGPFGGMTNTGGGQF